MRIMKPELHMPPIVYSLDGWSFEQSGYYMSKRGIVIILIMRWKTNFAPLIWTRFETVANGEKVTEYWPFADFDNKTIQVKAARFLNKSNCLP